MKTKLKFEVGHRYLYKIGFGCSLYECRVIEISKNKRVKLANKDSHDEEYFEWMDLDEDYEILEDLGLATCPVNQVNLLLDKGNNVEAEEPKKEIEVDGNTSDGYHTFNELYRYRMLYNAAFFNKIASDKKFKGFVGKSHRHSNGELCFDGGWFIVVANLPTGQISNHYEDKYWDLFKVNDFPLMPVEWDGHTPNEAADRLEKYIQEYQ